jgi:ABC-2 type transport system ATP-binding protein
MTTVISVEDVSKRFVLHKDKSMKERILNFTRSRQHREDFYALRNVSLDVESGSTVGLVGHNGSGKSTLLKTIGGIFEPTNGVVRRRGRVAALLELGAGFHPDLTGRENVFLNAALLGLSKSETERHFDAIVDFSGIGDFIDTQVKFYSSGMYVRLAFAVAIHVDPDVLLVDEVLAVGDEPFQRKCMDKIAEFQKEGRTIVLVSHSSEQVGRLCDRVLVLDHGVVKHDGDPAIGLKVLREGYDASRHSVSDLGNSASPLQLLDARSRVLSVGGRTDVEIDIDVHIVDPDVTWQIGIAIETTLGVRLYGMTTAPLGVSLPHTAGTHVIRLTLPDIRVGIGRYVVNVGLGDDGGTTYDRRSGITSFDIVDPEVGSGLLRLTPQVTTDPKA